MHMECLVHGGVMQLQLEVLPQQLKLAISERASYFVGIHLPLFKG